MVGAHKSTKCVQEKALASQLNQYNQILVVSPYHCLIRSTNVSARFGARWVFFHGIDTKRRDLIPCCFGTFPVNVIKDK
jgi:hypothetical protein